MVLYFDFSWASYLEWVDTICASLREVLPQNLGDYGGFDVTLLMFSVSLNKYLTRSNVRVKRFILAYIMGWCGWSWWNKGDDLLCGRVWATYLLLTTKQIAEKADTTDFFHYYSVCTSSPWDGVTCKTCLQTSS